MATFPLPIVRFLFSKIKSLPDMPIIGSSNSKANKDMMSKIRTNGGYSYLIELKTVRKGEIARYEQFLLFPRCFQKLSVVNTYIYYSNIGHWPSIQNNNNIHIHCYGYLRKKI